MFITLPKVFDSMPGGTYIGIAFFVMVFFAALTSSISLMETVVSIFCDKFRIGRRLCCVLVLAGSILLGLVSCFGYSIWSDIRIIGMQFLDFFDFASNSVIMPLVALLTCIFIGYIMKPQGLIEEVEIHGEFKRKRLFSVMIKYVAPILIVLIWVSSILDVLGIFKI